MQIKVLDHGFVRLVSYMQPAPAMESTPVYGFDGPPIYTEVKRDGRWTGDLEIVRNARVSFDADWRTGTDEGSDDRLVRRLHARGHTTPFEAMVFTFEVQAPIFVFRQWHRHRTWSYNELSARYAELPEVYYVPTLDQVRVQSKKDKQATSELMEESMARQMRIRVMDHSAESFAEYRHLLSLGVARELARSVLPVNTYSRMFATVDLHNLFHFLTLRLDSHAQYEIRVYAEAILQLIRPVCPVAVEAFEKGRREELTEAEWEAVLGAIETEADALGGVSEPEDARLVPLLRSALAKLKKA